MRLEPLVGLALALASWSAPAAASTFRQISLGELVQTSEAVVQVEVLDLRSDWSPGDLGLGPRTPASADGSRERAPGPDPDVRTWADLRVIRSLDGDLKVGDTLTVVEVGGSVGDRTVQAVGFPQFVAGAELVVFLTHWQDDTSDWRVAGYGQGFYEVVREAGAELLFPAAVQGNGPRTTGVTIDSVVPRGTRVDDLANAIRSVRR